MNTIKQTFLLLFLATVPLSFFTMHCMEKPTLNKKSIPQLKGEIEKCRNRVLTAGFDFVTGSCANYTFYRYICQKNKPAYLGLAFALPFSICLYQQSNPLVGNNFSQWDKRSQQIFATALLINPIMPFLDVVVMIGARRQKAELQKELTEDLRLLTGKN